MKRAIAVLGMVGAIGCGSSQITATRLEAAIGTTFANLVDVQVSRLGLPPLTARDFAATAICRRHGTSDRGAGDWTCTLVWQGPDRRTLRDTYDLSVTTDGCYTATATGEGLGGPTLKRRDGGEVRNLLAVFEGCFDPI